MTFPFENNKNITRMALSPNATLLITIDEDGRCLLINFPRRTVLHHHHFKAPVKDIQFSPNGAYFAVTHEKHIHVWKTPGFHKDFAPFVLHRVYTGHYDDVVSVSWSPDSKFFLSTSKDLSVRVYSVDPTPFGTEQDGNNMTNPLEHLLTNERKWTPVTLNGHRETVVGAWFGPESDTIYSISRDGAVFIWKLTEAPYNPDPSDPDYTKWKWRIYKKHFFNQNQTKVVSATFHRPSQMLIVGFSSGIFGIWELPDFTNIHTLSISQKKIDTCIINPSGEWLAFGSAKLGQLLVWEWQSESYVLKQQGHYYDVNTLSYSPDGQFIATGGEDGKLKVWNTFSGFCFVTFQDHSAGITRLEFSKKNQIAFSASMDGTVRAYDLIRYRNFRTFTSPTPTSFHSLAVDASGDIVVAGSVDNFEIYTWSVQTGKLLEVLSGHEGPISCLAFSPGTDPDVSGVLASGSWDKSVKLWEVFARGGPRVTETLEHNADVLSLAFRPDGKELAVTTLDGQITFWDLLSGKVIGSIEGRKDISGGRKLTDRRSAANSTSSQYFNSICYSADGTCVLAGGNSKYVCIYDIASKVLLKKFQISHNLSLDGMKELLNSKQITESGLPMEMIDESGDLSDLEDRLERDATLPGVRNGDKSARTFMKSDIRTKQVGFSPTARSFAAASTEGLLVYSLDETLIFDPLDLEMDVTPVTTLEALAEKEYLKALVMSFRLSENYLIQKVFESIPPTAVPFVTQSLAHKYLKKLLKFLSIYLDASPHVQFVLIWVNSIMKFHGRYLKERKVEYASALRGVHKGVMKCWDELAKVCDENTYLIKFVDKMGQVEKLRREKEREVDDFDGEEEEDEGGVVALDEVTMDMVI